MAYIVRNLIDLSLRCLNLSNVSVANVPTLEDPAYSTPARPKNVKPIRFCTVFASAVAIVRGEFSFNAGELAPEFNAYRASTLIPTHRICYQKRPRVRPLPKDCRGHHQGPSERRRRRPSHRHSGRRVLGFHAERENQMQRFHPAVRGRLGLDFERGARSGLGLRAVGSMLVWWCEQGEGMNRDA